MTTKNARHRRCIPYTLVTLLCGCLTAHRPVMAAEPEGAERPIRALLVIGGCCHDYQAQKDILTKGISARANVEWTVAYDPDKSTGHKNPVYESADWAKGFDVVVHDECSSQIKDPQFIERVLKPHREGLPAVVLHCGMHSYRSEGFPKDTPWFQFTGVGSTGHGPQLPIVVTYTDKEHPITKGLADWTTIREELYNNTRLYETAHPLARGKQTIRNRRTGQERVEDHVVAWTNEYAGKTRVFCTTLGHNNETVGDARHLDLVTRGLLWSVNKLDEAHLKPAKKVLSDEQPKQVAAAPADARANPDARASRANRSKIAAELKAPDGFDLTVFAAPPDINYPTAVVASPNGELFVAVDEMGSLGKEKGRGKVVRCVDTDSDGVADKFTDFAKMDHPRGLVWDDATRTLYVLFPPFLTRFRDKDADGVADSPAEVLVTGITNEKVQADRGADHTTNQIRLGIDGWIYIAMGDFGCVSAEGTDGSKLQMHGGGVVRVRPDGTRLEAVSNGQRNIYDVAIDPFMNLFTRDNTNDGDGWDVRLSHVVPTANFGYPRLFKNFGAEVVQPLAVLGGGSPCGSLYVDEPGLPAEVSKTLLTVEWGRNAIFRHPLTPDGASFKAAEHKWMDLPRGTDIDVDAHGRFYVSSWAGGSFTYSGPNVGYVLRLTPKNHKPTPLPDLKKLDEYDLVAELASPSAVRRLAAQREILHRGEKKVMPRRLKELAWSDQAPLEAVAAGAFTLGQLTGQSEGSERAEEFVLRAGGLDAYAAQWWHDPLSSKNPRIRLTAAWTVGGMKNPEGAKLLVPLLADSDPHVTHVAENGLVRLEAVEECLKAIDPSTPNLAPGAVRVLQRLYRNETVEGLMKRLDGLTDPALRSLIYGALCRLTFQEAEWDGSWWGTRPDTSGPFYKSATWGWTNSLKQFLRDSLSRETGEVQRSLLLDLQRHKIDLPEVMPLAAKLAQSDPTFKQVLVDLLASRPNLTDEHVNLLRPLALDNDEPPALRARAVRLLTRNPESPVSLDAGFQALAAIVAHESPAPELKSVLEDVIREQRFGRRMQDVVKLTESDQAPRRELAYMFLLNLSRERQGQNNPNDNRGRRGAERAREVLAQAVSDPARAASLERAMSRLGLKSDTPAPTSAQTMKGLDYAKASALVKDLKGDPKAGAALYTQLGCANCHTVNPNDPPKGPYLGDVATRYGRGDLLESILTPSSRIAQGFETQYFRTKKGDVTEGFVTRESADEVEYRDVNGNVATLKKSDIDRRGGREQSVMPEALADNLTPEQLAGLLAYLESLKGTPTQ